MNHPRIINENMLDQWVRSNAETAKGVIVELIWRLVSASCPSPLFRRFPLGDSIGQHGSDGELETDVGDEPFVPDGKSFWEIGTGVNVNTKATDVYNTSTSSIQAEVRKTSSFIFVTPLSSRRDWQHTWKEDGIATWLKERNDRKEWASVKVFTGTNLIDWLCMYPAVERWLAGIMGLPIEYIESVDARWETLNTIGSPPPLSSDIFLNCRALAIEKAREIIIDRSTRPLKLDTKYREQGADFVSALVCSLEAERKMEAIGRCLIVTQEEAWPGVCSIQKPHVLIADFDIETARGVRLMQAATTKGHSVIFSGMPGGMPHGNRVALPMPNEQQVREALEKSKYTTEAARLLSNKCGGDLNTLLRCVQGLSSMPEWAQSNGAAEIAIAMAFEGWKDDKSGDHTTIEGVVGKNYGEWIKTIREITGSISTPLNFRNGAWKMSSRYESWRFLGKHLFDDHVKKIKEAAVATLREKNPVFELSKEERFLANIKGKELTHSSRLRHGLANTLALMGSNPDALTACSDGLAVGLATVAVREILHDADWHSWASLNDVLPLLAEACPDVFLEAVDTATHSDQNVFSEVLAQESGGITGGTYITGLLWGLESLAWSPEYFTQTCRVLANFAAIDTGGSWTNRPSNTLTTILLPWFPQTCASPQKRHAAVKMIIRDQPTIAWKLLLTLLPEMHGTSSETHKPTWRPFIPENWKSGFTGVDEHADYIAYSEMALSLAGNDVGRLKVLIERYFRLPSVIRTSLRNVLLSEQIKELPEVERLQLWTTVTTLISNHRKFADHDLWKVPESALEELEQVGNDLTPASPEIFHQRLFNGNDVTLYEGNGDYENQRKVLEEKRTDAVRQIVVAGGFPLVRVFATQVEASWQVGRICGSLGDLVKDLDILPSLLMSEDKALFQFSSGFIWGRFVSGSWDWVDSVVTSKWESEATGQFFAFLPFCSETWSRVQARLSEKEGEYWRKASANPFETGKGIEDALGKLIDYGRSDAAIHCIQQMHSASSLPPELIIRALFSLKEGNRIDHYAIGELITLLQNNPATDQTKLCEVEFTFIQVLGEHRNGHPKALSHHLAESPDFFCEIITTLFRSKDAPERTENNPKPSEEASNKARNLYHLLREWRTSPGTLRDGTFDNSKLVSWLNAVKEKCLASGHWDIAANQIGEVLFYAPRDSSDIWIDPICEVLDASDAARIRSGLTTEIFNSRGGFWYSAGKAEAELADHWTLKAEKLELRGFSRLAQALRQLANSYRADSDREAKNSPYESR